MKLTREIARCLALMTIALSSQAPAFAQATAPLVPTGPVPTDLTPIRIREERELFQPGPTFYTYQKLPANFWFNMSTEINQRFESNVFLTDNQPKRDYIFRAFPNLTVGYNFLKNTGIYSNWFLIKDVYNNITRLTIPTTQSLSLGLRHNVQVGAKTNVQFDFQARELWQSKRLHQFDYLPGVLVSRVLTPKTVMFVNIQMQLRGGDAFVAPTREIDPFYTIGLLRSFGLWNLSISDTFITDYRDPPFHNSVPKQSNAEMISDIEIYRPIMKKHPGVVAFIRAEPIWNWDSRRTTGLSGFDFRLYSGIRIQMNKSPLGGMMSQMRAQLVDPTAPNSPPANNGGAQTAPYDPNANPPKTQPFNTAPPNTAPTTPAPVSLTAPAAPVAMFAPTSLTAPIAILRPSMPAATSILSLSPAPPITVPTTLAPDLTNAADAANVTDASNTSSASSAPNVPTASEATNASDASNAPEMFSEPAVLLPIHRELKAIPDISSAGTVTQTSL